MDLLLESCIWDRRLQALLSSDFKLISSDLVDGALENVSEGKINQDSFIDNGDFPATEIPIDGSVEGSTEILIDGHVEGDTDDQSSSTLTVNDDAVRLIIENGSAFHDFLVKPTPEDCFDAAEVNSQQDSVDSSVELQSGRIIPIATDIEGAASDSDNSIRPKHLLSVFSNLENEKGWIWAPFADIRREYIDDLQRGNLPKFESCSSYAAESVPQKVISDEGSRLHIPLGSNDYIVSDYEDEFSSIIACALALLKDAAIATEDLSEDARREKGIESSQSLPRMFSLASPHWSSFGSVDSDGIQSLPTNNLEDIHSSSFDGLNLLESLVSYGASHPEVSMGLGKNQATRKYSVVCVHASQFRQLRDRCCPSEVDYIASLSRCRNWDAKGGKSKSFFAKTLDDRFIIKEIKRTEFDAFMKFAPHYFEYMNQCYEKGNQTCLAKILGIYQVSLSTFVLFSGFC